MYRIMGLTDVSMGNPVFAVWDLSTITVSWIIIVTDTVMERLQIHLCALNACNVYSCQILAHSHYDNAFGITVLAL